MMLLRKISEAFGIRDGLCSRFNREADELINTARALKKDLGDYRKASDPFGALLSTMFNNHEFEKFPERPVDTGTKRRV